MRGGIKNAISSLLLVVYRFLSAHTAIRDFCASNCKIIRALLQNEMFPNKALTRLTNKGHAWLIVFSVTPKKMIEQMTFLVSCQTGC